MAIKNQDILRNYAGMIGSGGNVPLLIQALRQRQRDAEETDKANLKSGVKVGKVGLQAGKSFRDFAIARLANPNLSFADFMKNPTVAAKWVKDGASMVAKDPSLMPKSFDWSWGKMGAVGTALRDLGISPGRRAMEAEYGDKPQTEGVYSDMHREIGDKPQTKGLYADMDREILEGKSQPSGLHEGIVDKGWKDRSESSSGLEDMLQRRKVMYENFNPEAVDNLSIPSFKGVGGIHSAEEYDASIADLKDLKSRLSSGQGSGVLADQLKTITPKELGIGKEQLNLMVDKDPTLQIKDLLKEPASEVAKEGAEAVGGEVASAGLGDLFGAGSSLMSMAREGATPTNTLKGAGSLFQLLGLIPGLQPLAGLGTMAKGASYGTRALDIT